MAPLSLGINTTLKRLWGPVTPTSPPHIISPFPLLPSHTGLCASHSCWAVFRHWVFTHCFLWMEDCSLPCCFVNSYSPFRSQLKEHFPSEAFPDLLKWNPIFQIHTLMYHLVSLFIVANRLLPVIIWCYLSLPIMVSSVFFAVFSPEPRKVPET